MSGSFSFLPSFLTGAAEGLIVGAVIIFGLKKLIGTPRTSSAQSSQAIPPSP